MCAVKSQLRLSSDPRRKNAKIKRELAGGFAGGSPCRHTINGIELSRQDHSFRSIRIDLSTHTAGVNAPECRRAGSQNSHYEPRTRTRPLASAPFCSPARNKPHRAVRAPRLLRTSHRSQVRTLASKDNCWYSYEGSQHAKEEATLGAAPSPRQWRRRHRRSSRNHGACGRFSSAWRRPTRRSSPWSTNASR